jgi:glucokinase
MILAGDIGGTNTRLALFEVRGDGLSATVEATFPSRQQPNLEAAARAFLASHDLPVKQACFGVPGPVARGRSEATNLPWVVDAREAAAALRLGEVWLINDLEATAYGIAALPPTDFVALNPGAAASPGNAAVIAAGTGLGEAGLYWDGARHRPFACEGGHATFAPADETQVRLLHYLLKRYEHVSWERVLSGPGLVTIYQFLRDTGAGEEPAWLRESLRQGDPSAVISRAALEGRSPLCARALDLFAALYGAEAGNLALKVMATGGVFLGGGIAPKILRKLQEPGFREAFVAKGRMRSLLEAIPVRVIVNDKTALIGAARYAALRAGLLADA